MVRKNMLHRAATVICTSCLLAGIMAFTAGAAEIFDPEYYANTYPDVVAELGTSPQALLDHYLTFGMKEGRLPREGAAPGAEVEGATVTPAGTVTGTPAGTDTGTPASSEGNSSLVPMKDLVNLKSLRKKATDEQLAQAYNVAAEIVTPYIGSTREEQLYGIASTIRAIFDSGMTYSMSDAHYNDPYGYFILGSASCAGCTRATGLCLNMLGIPYEHVNENQYSHQWCRVEVNGTYWICDAFGLYCGPEPEPYKHPYLQ